MLLNSQLLKRGSLIFRHGYTKLRSCKTIPVSTFSPFLRAWHIISGWYTLLIFNHLCSASPVSCPAGLQLELPTQSNQSRGSLQGTTAIRIMKAQNLILTCLNSVLLPAILKMPKQGHAQSQLNVNCCKASSTEGKWFSAFFWARKDQQT